ncbi:hypothetical protein Pan216_18220 [Planctomycetes bacterium Pan216]|uniref:Methyltransferase FkbM domain-containing protein n=1 Tax=Kolteria novifilia TaxID=2527975 RepID=A0A518B1W3_9BACT|nr:hypothetical protein Pan216_18220 [Planctomycetes bacterium Pan216]
MAKPSQWLHEHAHDVTSQFGEDGIIEKALETIGQRDGWCVEFGAWDGKHLSNTHTLIADKGYSAVLIEGDPQRYQELCARHGERENVVPMNAFVGFEASDSLDTLLDKTAIPKQFDLLSIDIDGNDYHAWNAVTTYRPKLVVIEYNPSTANDVDFVQDADPTINHGSSLLALDRLAKEKGYELIATTTTNGIFVDAQYFPLFEIEDNSVRAMRTDEWLVTHLFCGYDGTVFVRGYGTLPWHEIKYNESRMQFLPKWLRKYPHNYSKTQAFVADLYNRWFNKRSA